MKNILSYILIFVGSNYTFAQTIEPIQTFSPARTAYRKSTQTTTNSMLFQGKDMTTISNFSVEYEQLIKKANKFQIIQINNKKYEGFVEIMGNKQEIKDKPDNLKPITIHIQQNGIIDSVIATEEMANQLKQTISGRIEKGKPNPHFLYVKSSKKLGDSWIDSSYFNDDKNYYIIHYKFDKQIDNSLVVTYTSDIKMLLNMEQNKVPFQTDVIGTANGTIYVEPTTNYILKSEGTMNLEGRMILNTDEFPVVIKGSFTDQILKK